MNPRLFPMSRFLVSLACAGFALAGHAEPTSAVQPHSPADAARRVADLKARFAPEEIRANDALLREFAEAHAALHGIAPPRVDVDRRLLESPVLSTGLRPDQVEAWRDLASLGWNARVSWNERRLTPGEIRPGISLRGASADEAEADLDDRLGSLLAALFSMTDADSRVLLDRSDAEFAQPHGTGPPLVGRRIRYERAHDGLPVFGDRFQVTLTRREHGEVWDVRVSSRWTRSIEGVGSPISPGEALEAARRASSSDAWAATDTPRLGFLPDGDTARPAWEIWSREDGILFRSYVSAADGGILDHQRQTAENHDGTIRAWVKRPHEDVPSPRPMPFLDVYEDAMVFPKEASCYFTPGFANQTRADTTMLNTTTDYAGEYENAVHFDAFDLSWVTDYRGPWLRDLSPYPNRTATGIPAGADHTISNSTANARNRRGELFYLMNYGARIYDAYILPQYEPMGFHFDALGAEGAPEGGCLDDVVTTSCCGGGTEPGCFWMECDMGTTGTPAAERRFREVAFHEQVHQLAYFANGGSLCSGCGGDPDTDGKECACWEEGRADFGAIAMGQFEKHRADFRPDKVYPDDWGGPSLYGPGSIYTSIYVNYLLRAGLDGLADVERNLDLVDGDTRMVGSCGSPTDWTTCPVNSFYRHLIANQEQWAFPRWRNSQEISAVFHQHVSDADRSAGGVQSFPWADGIPNRLFNPPTMYTDLEGASVVVAAQGNEGGGAIALNTDEDWDNVMFLAREGEWYTVETTNLAAGVDTLLEVRTIDANQSYLVGENDDCGLGPESCLTFQAQETGMHRIIVTSHPGTATGPSATYRISLESFDDVGDGATEADAFSPDDVMHDAHGTFESPGDVDVYAVVVPTAQALGFVGCSTNESFKVTVELRNGGGDLLGMKQEKKCDKVPKSVNVAPGTYFLHVAAKGGEVGGYGLRATLASSDIDTGDLASNAYAVTPDVGVGTMFENAFEEDWFRIDAVQGRIYVVEAIGVDGGVDPVLEVYAPDGTMYAPPSLDDTSGQGLGHWMMRNDDGGLRADDARTLFWAPVAGPFLVRVSPDAGSAAGRYHLLVHDNSGFTQDYPAFP